MGPATGGRIAAIAGIPGDSPTLYLGNASDGIFKSTDGGRRAVAEELAAEGVSLVLFAREDAALRATADAIAKGPDVPVLAVPADVGKPGEAERASYITGQSMVVDGGWVRGLL